MESSSDEEDGRSKKEAEKRPKVEEGQNRHKADSTPRPHKREEERKTKKETKEKRGDSGGSTIEKAKTHSGYHFNYGRPNNKVSTSKERLAISFFTYISIVFKMNVRA